MKEKLAQVELNHPFNLIIEDANGIITDVEVKELNELQAEYERLMAHKMLHTRDGFNEEKARRREAYESDPSEENFQRMKDYQILTEDRMREMMRMKDSVNRVIEDLRVKRVNPLVNRILSRVVERAEPALKQLEEAERKYHEKFGVAYTSPSGVLFSVRSKVTMLKSRVASGACGQGCNPKTAVGACFKIS